MIIHYIKRLSLLSFLPLSLLSLISCGGRTYYTSIKQIAPFLHEVVYEDTNDVLTNHKRDIGRMMDVWITTHSSIYNIEEKTLRLNVQEDYEHTYNYNLNF